MQLTKLVSLVLAGISAASAQSSSQAAPTGNSSATIYELLTAPNNALNVNKFTGLLASDSGYQSIIDVLNQPGNLTCFIPNNAIMTKLQFVYKAYCMRRGLEAGEYPPANFTISNLTAIDVVSYHCANESFQLNQLPATINVFHSLLNKTDVDLLGTGLPLLIENNATYSEFTNQTWLDANRDYLEFEVGNGESDTDVQYKDLEASNGWVNIIDSILVPPMKPTQVMSQVDETETLYKALKNFPDVADTLNNSTNFTLFAPDDKALRDIDFKNLSNDTIKAFLLDHIVPGVYYSTNITAETAASKNNFTLTSISGISLPVFVNGTRITLNDTAHVIDSNVFFNNGVMHVINKILNGTSM